MNPVVWHFESDLEYLTTIPIQYFDLLTNVTKTRITETTSFRTHWMFDLKDPHSTISNHFIITSHYQRTWIIIPSFSPILQYPISQYTHCFLLIPFIIHKRMDHWLLNRNCLILCFHWFYFFSWQGIWLSIMLVWNQWMNGRGERELKQQQQ